jgi:type I restriction enzyme R subunit
VDPRIEEAIEETEAHLRALGFDPARLAGAKGFTKRFEILARQVFTRFKALVMEPSVFAFAERHDNIEAIYKKLEERRDTADVTELLKKLQKIVNEAIRTQRPGDDQVQGRFYDLSRIDSRSFATNSPPR